MELGSGSNQADLVLRRAARLRDAEGRVTGATPLGAAVHAARPDTAP